MEFVKMHGAGNDFVVLPDLEDALVLQPALVRALCAPHTGLGADGVIRLGRPRAPDADVFMDYRNADGSLAEMCGNGVRCVAKYAVDRGLVAGDVVRVDTVAGVKAVEIVVRDTDGLVAAVRVDMGAPQITGARQIDVTADDGRMSTSSHHAVGTLAPATLTVQTLSMGNPHAVVLVEDPATAPVDRWGPAIAQSAAFEDGTNVEFIAVPAPGLVVGRIWERGVGETLASGTGAAAMAVGAHVYGLTGRAVTVRLPGGELEVDWSGETLHVTGPAVEVARGALDPKWLVEVA